MPKVVGVKLCWMCKRKRAKVLEAVEKQADGSRMEYVNTVKFPLFCSMHCAANWALLWANAHEGEEIQDAIEDGE